MYGVILDVLSGARTPTALDRLHDDGAGRGCDRVCHAALTVRHRAAECPHRRSDSRRGTPVQRLQQLHVVQLRSN